MEGSGETRLEAAISYVLITGVIVSILLEIAGMALFYLSYDTLAVSERAGFFIRGENFFAFLAGLIFGKSSAAMAIRLMMLGVALLILTPYIRAVMSVVYFASRGNIKYLAITLFVLIALTMSLLFH